jgi:hypothetical protein
MLPNRSKPEASYNTSEDPIADPIPAVAARNSRREIISSFHANNSPLLFDRQSGPIKGPSDPISQLAVLELQKKHTSANHALTLCAFACLCLCTSTQAPGVKIRSLCVLVHGKITRFYAALKMGRLY